MAADPLAHLDGYGAALAELRDTLNAELEALATYRAAIVAHGLTASATTEAYNRWAELAGQHARGTRSAGAAVAVLGVSLTKAYVQARSKGSN